MLKSLKSWFLDDTQLETSQLWLARKIAIVLLGLGVITAALTVQALGAAETRLALTYGSGCLLLLLAGILLRLTHRPARYAQLAVAVTAGLLLVAWSVAPALAQPWVSLLPLVALLLLEWPSGWAWTLGAVAGLIALDFSHLRSQPPASHPVDLLLAVLTLLAVALITSGLVVLQRKTEARWAAEARVRKQAEQEARAANLAKSEFLTNMSHEIRTPLSAVIGLADLLAKDPLTESQRGRVEAINTSAEVLLALVNDVLDLAKIEAGKVTLNPREFQPREMLAGAERVLAPRARQKGLHFLLEVDEALPKALWGDPTRLRQVLLNLVGNAIKFTPAGQVEVRIRSEDVTPGRIFLRCEVVDTGIGIAPEAQKRLFTPFYQADSSLGRRFGGSGLGLVISRRLVELMGGEIGCESVRDVGSTFWFRVPLKRIENPAMTPTPVPEKSISRAHVRVLVVEDNAINRMVLVAHLQAMGIQSTAAEDGHEALALWKEQRFSVILMDCQLPGIDGYETTRQLRQQEPPDGPRTLVIAVTAHALKGERERCLAAGMDDYIAKPFRGEDLAAVLDRWLEPKTTVDPEGT